MMEKKHATWMKIGLIGLVSATASIGFLIGQPIIAIIGIVLGLIGFLVLKKNYNELELDERTEHIQGRAAYSTLRITFVISLIAIFLIWLINPNSLLFYSVLLYSGFIVFTYLILLIIFQTKHGDLY